LRAPIRPNSNLRAPLFGVVAGRGVLFTRDLAGRAKLVEEVCEIALPCNPLVARGRAAGPAAARAEILAAYEGLLVTVCKLQEYAAARERVTERRGRTAPGKVARTGTAMADGTTRQFMR
jgi:hypothetical protein